MILGFSGFAGVGKDKAANVLIEKTNNLTVRIALADPIKRIIKEAFNFSDHQLWGPSEERNKPDYRYSRKKHEWVLNNCVCCGIDISNQQECFLTPRYALHCAGTNFGRHCYDNAWVEYTLRIAQNLIHDPYSNYTPFIGLIKTEIKNNLENIVISDCRFINELKAIKDSGGKLVRVKRTGYENPRWNLKSETEQTKVPDSEFDYILYNDSSLGDLREKIDEMVKVLGIA